MATPADAPALRTLAELDSAPMPPPAPMLVAEVGGDLQAAAPVEGGPAIANPFRPTADLVALLEARRRATGAHANATSGRPRFIRARSAVSPVRA